MKFERLTDPTEIHTDQIAGILKANAVPVIQFSKPIKDVGLLKEIDKLCQKYGDRIEVRFYGFYSERFNATLLRHVPNVQWLSVDCLMQVESIETIFELTALRKLSLGVFELNDSRILDKILIKNLRELSIGETRSGNIDLTPLAQCQQLSHLYIEAQPTGMDVLKGLSALTVLTLRRVTKKHPVSVVNEIPRLEKLTLILGGRANIEDVYHAGLRDLEIIRVLGLSDMGDLSRFPSLQKLFIEDQIRLESIDMMRASSELRQLTLVNCKKLASLGSLAGLNRLEQVVILRTSADFDAVTSTLPKSVSTVRFMTGKKKPDELIRKRLDALGYKEFNRVQPKPLTEAEASD